MKKIQEMRLRRDRYHAIAPFSLEDQNRPRESPETDDSSRGVPLTNSGPDVQTSMWLAPAKETGWFLANKDSNRMSSSASQSIPSMGRRCLSGC